jgi:hypothetical protein
MDSRAVRGLVVAVVLGAVVAAPVRRASAFTMAEQMGTTGVANTVAGTGARSASGTIGSVKNKLSSSTRLGTPKVSGASKVTGVGAGKPTRKRTASGKTGWGEAKGWARNGKGGGKSGKAGWTDSGGWPKADGWSSKGSKKTWAAAGGGSWARPGKKS